MRILLIHQYFLEKGAGGGSRFNEMTRIWGEKGHETIVIGGMVHYTTGKKTPKYKGKFICREEYSEKVSVYRCHVSEAYNTNFMGRLWAYFSFVFSSVFCGLFKVKGKFDVVLVTSPPLFVGITGLILAFFKKCPFVFEVRDLWPESAIDTGVLTNPLLIRMAFFFEKLVYRKASLINTLTPAFQKTLIEKKLVSPEKVIMIPNAADFSIVENMPSDFDPEHFRRKHNLHGKFVVLYVGAHGIANHLIQIVDTAEKMKNTNALFLCIGEGMQKIMLKEECNKRGLNNIRFLDAVSKEDVFRFILASDAGASVLKKCDTFKTVYSNKTFDYMSCKKPVLLAIDGVSRELVEEADCGLFVEPENAEDFKNKVFVYLNNKDLVSKHGINGYLFAKEHFDREKLSTKYIEALETKINL